MYFISDDSNARALTFDILKHHRFQIFQILVALAEGERIIGIKKIRVFAKRIGQFRRAMAYPTYKSIAVQLTAHYLGTFYG